LKNHGSFILILAFWAKLCAGRLPVIFLSRRNKWLEVF
jgi:hypothetical protein